MTECIVTGMPNVGKTCFVINFAEYMGLNKLKFYVRQVAGYTSVRCFSPIEARNQLISEESNYTRDIQSVKLEIPVSKVFKELEIIDSCGLSEGIHPDDQIRLAMAQTIRLIRESRLILHMIDLTMIKEGEDILLPLDRMILNYAQFRHNYAILANKIDLKMAQTGLKLLRNNIVKETIIPISALYQQGFEQVKKLVLSYV
jgi:predicted GTPase